MQGTQTPPRTIMEVFKMLPEGTLAELIEGTLYMSPAPKIEHQRILGEIFIKLSAFAKENSCGEVFIAPCDVYLDSHSNAVEPDIIFVSSQNKSIVKESSIQGTPNLLIEILSPGNTRHDFVIKKNLYEKFGVQEYWIINPDTKETTGYTLKDKIYNPIASSSGKINSVLLSQNFEF